MDLGAVVGEASAETVDWRRAAAAAKAEQNGAAQVAASALPGVSFAAKASCQRRRASALGMRARAAAMAGRRWQLARLASQPPSRAPKRASEQARAQRSLGEAWPMPDARAGLAAPPPWP